MTQGSAAKKAKCGRTQIVRTSDHVPSHKIDESEVLYSTCASPARGESNPTLSVSHTHTHTRREMEGGDDAMRQTSVRRESEGGEP